MSWFRKGCPTLFSYLKALYRVEGKAQLIEGVLTRLVKGLRETSRFPSTPEGEKEPPTALLWALYFSAYHEDILGHTEDAIELIDEAIAHTPTLVEVHMAKGRILKVRFLCPLSCFY